MLWELILRQRKHYLGMSKPPLNPFFNGLLPHQHILKVLKRIRAAELDEALMVLSFDSAAQFLKYLDYFIEQVCFRVSFAFLVSLDGSFHCSLFI